ncbi:MAG: O-antigen ligase family protein [Candidatus Methylomirabilales bacterium]
MLAVTFLGVFIGMRIVPSLANLELPILGVVTASLIVAIGTGVYLLTRPSFDRAVNLMMLTLPMLAALVIDIGGSIRVTYVFTLLAIFFGVSQGRFTLSTRGLTVLFLHAYVVYALISISYTLAVPHLESLTMVGFRGSTFRSFIQFGQLLLMVAVFHVILNYARSVRHVEKLCNLIFWATVLVAIYGFYEFFAFLFNFPYVNLINTPLDAPEGGPMSLGRRLGEDYFAGSTRPFAGIELPRPRSFMGEAQFLTTYLLFSVPFSVIAALTTTTRHYRWLKLLCVFAFVILFVLTNSRSGFIAIAGVLPVLLFFAPGWRARLSLIMGVLTFMLILSFVVFPLVGAGVGLGGVWRYIVETYQFILDMSGRQGFLRDAINVFLLNPLFGVGIGNYIFYVDRTSGFFGSMVPTAGNIYMRVISELGVIGMFLFLGFVGSIFFGVLKIVRKSLDYNLRRLAFATLIAFAGTMICLGAVSGLYTDSYIWVMWAMGAAVVQLKAVGHRMTPRRESSENGQIGPTPRSVARSRDGEERQSRTD